MDGTALRQPLTWRPATIIETRRESPHTRTLVLEIPGWDGHVAGQHVDVRLTASDGYQTQRRYSIASAAALGVIEITVDLVPDGEVSPYLVSVARVGDQLDVRGPFGAWFTWTPTIDAPVLLVGGGSGIVPLMSMIRARSTVTTGGPFLLVHSVRSPDDQIYGAELHRRVVANPDGLGVSYVYTRRTPAEWPAPAGRIAPADLAVGAWLPDREPLCYVCGPDGFVEAASGLLLDLGHPREAIRTERFGAGDVSRAA